MAILTTGNTFSTGQQILAASLNAAVNNAAFAAGAIDVATMQFVGTNDQIGIKDSGVTTAKIASLAVTGAKIAETTITPTKLSAGAPAWTATALNVTNSLDFSPVTTAASGTYARTLFVVTVTMTAHGMVTGNVATLAFSAGTGGTATNGAYPITVTDANTFTITDTVSGTITGTPSVSRTNYYGNSTVRGSESVTGNLSVTGNTAITGSATVAGALSVTEGEIKPLVRATAQSATGTSIDFTGIPSWVKRIIVIIKGVSTNGASLPRLQIGDAGGIETSGYDGIGSITVGGGTAIVTYLNGFDIYNNVIGATDARSGLLTLCLIDSSTNTWVCSGTVATYVGSQPGFHTVSGSKSLSAILDRVRLTTANGTDTFDAGSINIMYE
jgi:hypothetical protein